MDKKLQIPANLPSEKYLPVSHKGFNLISFKANYFFEVQEESADIAKTLVEMPGSYVSFCRGKFGRKITENGPKIVQNSNKNEKNFEFQKKKKIFEFFFAL